MAESNLEKEIAGQRFFEGIKPRFLEFLAGHAKHRRLKPNEVLHRVDQPAERFYVLTSGRIAVEIAAIEGPPLGLQELKPGAILGWSWLIPPYRWAFQARAEEESEVIEFDGKAVRERCEEDPEFGYDVLKRFSALMSERLEFARRKMMDEWSPPGFA